MPSFRCPVCSKKLKAAPDAVGKRVKCSGCGEKLVVPGDAAHVPHRPGVQDAKPVDKNVALASDHDLADSDRQNTIGVELFRDHTLPGAKSPVPPPKKLIEFLAPAQGPGELGRLGPYRILSVLGHGGMGVVYLAEDAKLKRRVALKAMLPAIAANDEGAAKRFLREAQAMAQVKHPHIASIYQVEEDRGTPYLAMEFLLGESLDDRLKRQKILPTIEVLRLGRQVAEGLHAAHKRGLIHRDIKPANIWLESDAENDLDVTHGPTVKILDFGLARSDEADTHLTKSGMIVGTPAYMAPEQGRAGNVDARSDIFSLGVVLYRMATGELPFKGADQVSTLLAVAMDAPKPPQVVNFDVPIELSDLILTLLAKNPDERLQTAKDVAVTLASLGGASGSISGVPLTAYAKKPATPTVTAPVAQPVTMMRPQDVDDTTNSAFEFSAPAMPALTMLPKKPSTGVHPPATPTMPAAAADPSGRPAKSSRWIWLTAAGAVVALVPIIVLILIFAFPSRDTNEPPKKPTDTPVATTDDKKKPEPRSSGDDREAATLLGNRATLRIRIDGLDSDNNERVYTPGMALPKERFVLVGFELVPGALAKNPPIQKDTVFKHLRKLNYVTSIDDKADDLRWSDAEFKDLASMNIANKLESLNLPKARLTSKSVESMRPFKKLIKLQIDISEADDGVLLALASALPALESLRLDGLSDPARLSKLSRKGWERFGSLSSLTLNNLERLLPADWLAGIAELPRLSDLEMGNADAASISALAKSKTVKKLTVGGKDTAEAALAGLLPMVALTKVTLGDTIAISAAGVEKWAETIPTCEIQWKGRGFNLALGSATALPELQAIAESKKAAEYTQASKAKIPLTGESALALSQFTNLRSLVLAVQQATAADLAKVLPAMPKLQSLTLDGYEQSSLRADALGPLATSPVKSLTITLSVAADATKAAAAIAKIPSLETLDVKVQGRIADAFKELANCPRLISLSCDGDCGDGDVLHLKDCKSLRSIVLKNNLSVTTVGIEALANANPALRVEWREGIEGPGGAPIAGPIARPKLMPGGSRWQIDLVRQSSDGGAMGWSPDGKWLAFGAADRVRILDAESKKLAGYVRLRSLQPTWPSPKYSWSADSQKFALANGNSVSVFSADGTPDFEGRHENPVLCAAFHPDGRLVSGAARLKDEASIKVWQANGQLLTNLTGHADAVSSLEWNADGNALASLGRDKSVRLWGRDLSPKLVIPIALNSDGYVAWSSDGKTLSAATLARETYLWDVGDDQKAVELKKIDNGKGGLSLCWANKGKRILAVNEAGGTFLDRKGGEFGKLNIPNVRNFCYNEKADSIAVWYHPGHVSFVRENGETLSKIDRYDSSMSILQSSGDGRFLAVGGGDGYLRRFDWIGQTLATINPEQFPTGLATNRTSDRWAVLQNHGGKIIDSSGNVVISLWDPGNHAWCFGWSPDGRKIAAVGNDNRLRILDNSGKLLHHSPPVLIEGVPNQGRLEWSPDGQQIAVLGISHVSIWSATGKLELIRNKIGDLDIYHSGNVAWIDKGTLVVCSCPQNGKWGLEVISASGKRQQQPFDVHGEAVRDLRLSPDGRRVARTDGTNIRIVSLIDGKVEIIPGKFALSSLAWSGDGTKIATNTDCGSIRCYDSRSLEPLWTAMPLPGGRSAVFDAEGKLLNDTSDIVELMERELVYLIETPTKRLQVLRPSEFAKLTSGLLP